MLNFERFGILRFLKASLRLAFACLFATLAGQAQTYTILHSFAGSPNDGAFANGELIQDAAGNIYGTTEGGGAQNFGTIFKLDPTGAITILHSFGSAPSDGTFPEGGLLLDATGNLYGTTNRGGVNGAGTVFELNTSNKLRTLFSFGFGESGSSPHSRLVTINGDLYGVAGGGGNCQGCGIIYKVTKGGTETVLYQFTGGADGASPAGVFRDSAGNLYGAAVPTETTGSGTIFQLALDGVFSVLYTFSGGTDGDKPIGRVIRDTSGNIHGVTSSGGDPTCNCGTLFRLDNSEHKSVIHDFFGHGGGAQPFVGPVDAGGVLFGTTAAGGDSTCYAATKGCGVLYEVSRTGQYTVLHRFAGSVSGDGDSNLVGGLTVGTDGSIYGATWYGGTGNGCSGPVPGCGVIFKYTP